ncbi:VCBS repeat-containing protein [Thalassomonas viridans]|uniref:VCBS repeat-containing protein n=1 Tax=Thalassomonas viridans TaxID=137584 RepID=A0AAE9Z7Z7_9GAMM|nr:VCBS repeat-containing protein [Thalassomonas viridans]WDE07927.1 VCBS repeat-containing protein [Thalassomonas viridans]
MLRSNRRRSFTSISLALLLGTPVLAGAVQVHTSGVPLKRTTLPTTGEKPLYSSDYGDLDNNGTNDIFLLEKSNSGPGIQVLLNRVVAGDGKYDKEAQRGEWSELFLSGQARFSRVGFPEGLSITETNTPFMFSSSAFDLANSISRPVTHVANGDIKAVEVYTVEVTGTRGDGSPDNQTAQLKKKYTLGAFPVAVDEISFFKGENDNYSFMGRSLNRSESHSAFIAYRPANGYLPVKMSDASDGSAQIGNTQNLLYVGNSNTAFGDFNGDGLDDFVRWDRKKDLEGVSNTDDGHAKIDIWFAQEGENATFKRSYLYLDADNDYLKTSNDNQLNTSFTEFGEEDVRIGDFNGDGSSDILFMESGKYTIYTSHAVQAKVDRTGRKTVTRSKIGLFSKSVIEDSSAKGDNPLAVVADFNNDNRDDIATITDKPFILYSTTGSEDANGKDVSFVGIKHTKALDDNGSYQTLPSTVLKNTAMTSADFNGDGFNDLLLLAEDTLTPVLYLMPPYDPVAAVSQEAAHNVKRISGVSYKNKKFVFFGEDNEIKYIYKDENGWQKAQTLPLYLQDNDVRCNNDIPAGKRFLGDAAISKASQSGEGGYLVPVCNAGYHGQAFDVETDGKYVYLFRAHGLSGYGTGTDVKVLVDRFEFSEVDNKFLRLIESRYKSSGKRYVASDATEVVTKASQTQSFTEEVDISTLDKDGNSFLEPAFVVPYALAGTLSSEICQIDEISAAIAGEGKGRQRLFLTTGVNGFCSGSEHIDMAVASYRLGTDQVFDTNNISYLKDGTTPAISKWHQTLLTRGHGYMRGLDSIVIDTSAAATASGDTINAVVDRELVIATNNNGTETIFTHIPIDSRGEPKQGQRELSYTRYDDVALKNNDTGNSTLFFGSDGLLHHYFRAATGDIASHVLDPTLNKTGMRTNWGQGSADTVRSLEFSHSWPAPSDRSATGKQQALVIPRIGDILPKWSPKFGVFYQGSDVPVSDGFAPVVFTSGRLTEFGGRKEARLVREYVTLLKQDDGSYKFAFSYEDRGQLKSRFAGRVVVSSTPIGYMEGPPPVPRENLGRNQNGIWTYSTELSDVEIQIEKGTTVSTDANNALGAKANGYVRWGGKAIFVEHSLTASVAVTGGATFGKAEDYSLSKNISRKSFITGSVPSRKCNAGESAYLDTCYEENADGSKIELWAPHTEGTLFTSTLSASRYAMYNPKTNRLVGYTLDFSDAAENEESINFKLNPEYLKAGSLDGYIGPKKVDNVGFSYFNPREESGWRTEDKRQQLELEKRYKAAANVSRAGSTGTSAEDFIRDKLLISGIAVSDGGFTGTSTTAAGSVTDRLGYDFSIEANVDYVLENPPTGAGFGVGVGGYYSRSFVGSKNNTSTVNFVANIDQGVTSEVQDDNNNTLPWAVDKYNSRSYFLPASDVNSKFFFERVVSPHLIRGTDLHESEITTARILKQMRESAVPVWRVTHRVDGVSRYIPNPN